MTELVRVLLVDDHKLVRAGIRALLLNLPWLEIIGEASEGQSALNLIRAQRPNVVLLDIAMPHLNGLEALNAIKEFPEVKVIMLSMHTNKEYVWQALRAGASGYIIKDADIEELGFAIKSVMQGQLYLSPAISKHIVTDYLWRSEPTIFERLTSRQRQILQLIAEGYTTKEIAENLQIGIKTAETHRSQLMEQLDIHDVAGLVRYAIKMGLVSIED